MSNRIHLRRLKPDEPTPEDVLGKSCTLELPNKTANLQEAAQACKSFHENADLFIQLLQCGAMLFPVGVDERPPKRDLPPSAS